MASTLEIVNRALASIATAAKDLGAIQAARLERSAVEAERDAERSELAGIKAARAREQVEFAKEQAAHSDWQQKAAKERAKSNAEIDRLQERLRALEGQVAERRAEHDSIVGGIAALAQRLKVG
jgi:hypothetical protein